MPFLLCNILIAFPLFFDISSLVFCTSPWVLGLKIPLYAYIYAGVCVGFTCFTANDRDFSIERRDVFTKTTCCFR